MVTAQEEELMEEQRTILKLTLVAAIAFAAVAMLLAWGQPAQERAEAASGGPEMGLSVPLGHTTTCPSGTPSGHVCVEAGNSFTLSLEAIGIRSVNDCSYTYNRLQTK